MSVSGLHWHVQGRGTAFGKKTGKGWYDLCFGKADPADPDLADERIKVRRKASHERE